tara:strand:+ start:171 stop:374 length:204 start_codon:yes stop_codon:yes gene_type:complete
MVDELVDKYVRSLTLGEILAQGYQGDIHEINKQERLRIREQYCMMSRTDLQQAYNATFYVEVKNHEM